MNFTILSIIFRSGQGRASDMPPIQSTDSADLQAAKEQIIQLIGNFSIPISTHK